MTKKAIFAGIACAALLAAGQAHAQELPVGVVIYSQPGLTDPSIQYSIYLPKGYTPEKAWPTLFGFHFEGRGALIVEKYREAAEKYGYIVAASNVSRNGDWAQSVKAAQSMINDVGQRVSIDPARVYTTGLSGGARLSMHIAMTTGRIAGVIASSAGFPDGQDRSSLRFPVFMTAGSYDFNYLEMRKLDRTLKSAHRLAFFEGGHVLPSDEVAMRGIEWMELQAMCANLRPRDEAFIAFLWARREKAVQDAGETPEGVRQLQSMVEDFRRLRDVKDVEARANDLAKRADVKAAIEAERRSDLIEAEIVEGIIRYEIDLVNPAKRNESYTALRQIISDLRRSAENQTASVERARARRVLEAMTYEPTRRVKDADYMKLLAEAAPKR